ncbi:MAG: hypothetical protein AAGN82_17915 [Myxococcota bacterium]
MTWRYGLACGVGLVASVAWAGCAATSDEDDDDDDTTTDPSGPGAGGAASTTSGAGGTVDEVGGSGGEDLGPCGQDCSAITAPACFVSVCNTGTLPGPVGSCVVVPDDDGTACDDGLFCTVDDTCQAGVCTGGPANDCGMSPPECTEIVCDETAQSCTQQSAGEGTACTPADLCEVGGTCQSGQCVGTPNDCFFAPVPNECFNPVCNPQNGMCEPVAGNDGAACVDTNDLCSEGNTCNAGVCGGGTPIDCSALTMDCDLGVCDPATGMCGTMTVMDGQTCDDLDACTAGETCTMGTCGGGTPITTCSGATVADGCCPSVCTPANDLDCACAPGDLTSPFNTNNGLDGSMFDIVAKGSPVTIDGFDVNVGTAMETIEIYYRPGTWVGFDNSSVGWILVGSAMVTGNGNDTATPVPINVGVTIPANQTYAFYVTTTDGGMNYSNGTTVGAVDVEDAAIQVLEGKGKAYPFTGGFDPRVWSGTVYYTVCGN